MAIYHLHVKNISRRHGRSIVAAAAYRAGEVLPNEAEERESHFGGRRDVIHAEIILPADAPAWMRDRATLWNAVERSEKRKDARLAKEIEFSLPRELPPEAWVAVARHMASHYAARGYVADFAIHDDGLKHNPHVHMLLTTRAVSAEGFGAKLRAADHPSFITDARKIWAGIANEALGKVGAAVEIDHRSHATRGVEQRPSQHRGPNRQERRERREQARQARENAMNPDDIRNAYRLVISDPKSAERYPNLYERADWPPRSPKNPPVGLTREEREEFSAFWRDVKDALPRSEPEREAPRQNAEQERQKLQDIPQQARETAERFVEKFRPITEPTAAQTIKEWKLLEERLHERMRRDGIDPGEPSDWREIAEQMASFREKLVEMRAIEQENHLLKAQMRARELEDERMQPVPDPLGNSISQRELDEAQDRAVEDYERPMTEEEWREEVASTHRPPLSDVRDYDQEWERLEQAHAEYEREPEKGRDRYNDPDRDIFR
ncbi:MAG: hypothetical protein CMJ42_16275 [Phyllobacteriaceae bacterium]|nr:hypothetical protein [Phyllobacteriaceae bacterium]MBA89258.1 hypothetical protein [Phyllobacteriaceae bacterium]